MVAPPADIPSKFAFVNSQAASDRSFPNQQLVRRHLADQSGTVNDSTTASLHLPFSSIHGGNGVRSGSPSTTISQSPTLNVAVFESQESYKGMLPPIGDDQMLTYQPEGLSPEPVYSLMFGSIHYRETPGSEAINLVTLTHSLKDAARVQGSGLRIALCPELPSEYACLRSVQRTLLARHLQSSIGRLATGRPS